MKIILTAVLILFYSAIFCQEITVSASNDSITVLLQEDNTNKLLIANTHSPAANNFVTVNVRKNETYKDWKRIFFIDDSTGNAVKDFKLMNDGSYCIRLSELKTLLQPKQEYFIYTVATPKDPQKAMLVKPARILVCKIKIL